MKDKNVVITGADHQSPLGSVADLGRLTPCERIVQQLHDFAEVRSIYPARHHLDLLRAIGIVADPQSKRTSRRRTSRRRVALRAF